MLDVAFARGSDRTMKALTGLSGSEFDALLPAFAEALQAQTLARRSDRQRKPGGGAQYRLASAADKLFFILFYIKCYPTVDVASVLYRTHRSRPNRWVQAWLPVLEAALGHKAVLPERKIHDVETLFTRFPQAKDLFVDGTERPVRRPAEPAREKRHFSGKKKRHTLTNLVASAKHRRILALAPTRPGTYHDYAWPCPTQLPFDVVLWTDSGFQGMKTDYPQLQVIQPQKKPKGQSLDPFDRFINRQKARIRLRVEHAIGGVKRYGALTQPYRNHTPHMDDQLMLVACRLWNLHLNEAA